LGLPAGIGDRHHIRRVVDDDGVVNVVVDDVAWRRFHILRWPHPYGNGRIIRDRKNECIDRRRWWRQIDKIDWTRRQEDDRRRRRRSKSEIGIVECQNRALNVDYFLWRWWRHVIRDDRKPRRRFKGC
jgi:hypothetical protein